MKLNLSSRAFHVFLFMTVLAIGCGQPHGEEPNSTRMGGLTRLVSDYLITNRGTPPENKQSLLDFAQGLEGTDQFLRDFGVDSVQELFESEHDNQPFQLLFGKDLDVEYGVVAYQRTPIDGERWVGFRSGLARKVSDSEFQEMNLKGTNPEQ